MNIFQELNLRGDIPTQGPRSNRCEPALKAGVGCVCAAARALRCCSPSLQARLRCAFEKWKFPRCPGLFDDMCICVCTCAYVCVYTCVQGCVYVGAHVHVCMCTLTEKLLPRSPWVPSLEGAGVGLGLEAGLSAVKARGFECCLESQSSPGPHYPSP